MTHRPGETLQTGTDFSSATAVATAAEVWATVLRAEMASSGNATDEVHMAKADGSPVTVALNSSFAVIGIERRFGARPADGRPNGIPPADLPHIGTPSLRAATTSHRVPLSLSTGLANHAMVGQLHVRRGVLYPSAPKRPAVVCTVLER